MTVIFKVTAMKPQISQHLVYLQMVLQPHVRYQLPHGAKLYLADVSAVYQRLSDNVEGDNDSGSETGSESVLTVNNSVVEGESSAISGLINGMFHIQRTYIRLNCAKWFVFFITSVNMKL
jgi:hypothetical protein